MSENELKDLNNQDNTPDYTVDPLLSFQSNLFDSLKQHRIKQGLKLLELEEKLKVSKTLENQKKQQE